MRQKATGVFRWGAFRMPIDVSKQEHTHITSQYEDDSGCVNGQLGLICVCVCVCALMSSDSISTGFNESHSLNHAIQNWHKTEE